VATGLHELRRRNGRVCAFIMMVLYLLIIYPQILVTSMCIGTGMGAAAVFVGEA
jgi:hypothetical protein